MSSLPQRRRAADKTSLDYVDIGIMRLVEFMTNIYSSIDQEIQNELNRLHLEDGIVPSCKKGCSLCCSQHIITSIVEVKTLAYHIRINFSPLQIKSLRSRIAQWLIWDEARRGKIDPDREGNPYFLTPNRFCPMLVDGKCSTYDMRPLICRRFFVSSNPSDCLLNHLTGTAKSKPEVLSSVISKTITFENQIITYIKNLGLDYQKSLVLLPHRLSLELNGETEAEAIRL